ncbi:MAG: hypothetical protein LBF78_12740 [Treponema sp.]|jgi:hypothetical protein|nr:hypothetical protein [Treponema sp.]
MSMAEKMLESLPQLIISASAAFATILGVLKANRSRLDKLLDGLKMVSQDINRLTLHDEHLSDEERLAAGERYTRNGGNGVTRAYYENLLADYKKKLE